MKTLLAVFILIITVNAQTVEKSVSQLTWGYIRSASDSVVLSDLREPDLPFYTRITIYRKRKRYLGVCSVQ